MSKIVTPLSDQDRTLIDHYVRSRVGLIPEAVKRLLDLYDHSLAGLSEIRSQAPWPSASTSSHQEFAAYIEHVAECAADGRSWLDYGVDPAVRGGLAMTDVRNHTPLRVRL